MDVIPNHVFQRIEQTIYSLHIIIEHYDTHQRQE